MAAIEFRVLGPLEILINGEPRRIASHKQQIVLHALIVADGKEVPMGSLADKVWDGSPPGTASKQIRNAISSLRSTIGEAGSRLLLSPNGYLLDTTGSTVDLTEFHSHVAEARRQLAQHRAASAIVAYRAALSLWRGPAVLPGGGQVVQGLIARLNEQRLAVLEDCIGLELADGWDGRLGELIGELHELVAEHPLRERLVGQLMIVLYRSGARARAFDVYARTQRLLVEELGLCPGNALQDLHRRMLIDDPTISAPAMYLIPGQRRSRTQQTRYPKCVVAARSW